MPPSLAQPAPVAEDAVGDENVEMANLRQEQTGVPGVIFISTRMGAHGPRVKWYEDRPLRGAPSFSVDLSDPPMVVASDVDIRLQRQVAPKVATWVGLNREALREFWERGAELFEDERAALFARLRRLD